MSNNEYYIWEHETFRTYTDLKNYIDKIKPLLIGERLTNIFIPTWQNISGLYIKDMNILETPPKCHSVDCYDGGAGIIRIGNHNLFVDTYSGSYLEISLDTKFEVLKDDEIQYAECSFIFTEHIIGQKIIDIYPTRATGDEDFGLNFVADDCISNDMFKYLVIKFANNYRLLIGVLHDFCEIFEHTEDDYSEEYKVVYVNPRLLNNDEEL